MLIWLCRARRRSPITAPNVTSLAPIAPQRKVQRHEFLQAPPRRLFGRHLAPVAYRRMLDVYYKTEKPLPVEPTAIFRLVRITTKLAQRRAVQSVLREYFTLKSDGWHQKRCDEEIAKATAQAETNKRIAFEREAKFAADREAQRRHGAEHESLNESLNDSSGLRAHVVLTS